MSIYSANRTGCFNLAMVEADRSYGMNDFGRILCECQENDMAFFEAALACDFHEINNLREGTLLEAEVEKANTEAKKSLWTKVVESLKKLWAKLKGVFDNAIEKLANNAVANKMYAKSFKKNVNYKDWTGDVAVDAFDPNNKAFDIGMIGCDLKNGAKDDYYSDPAAIIKRTLSGMVGTDDVSISNYTELALKASHTVDHIKSASDVDLLITLLGNSDKLIKGLKDTSKKAEKSISDLVRTNVDDLNVSAETILNVTNAYKKMITIVSKATIVAAKSSLKAYKVGLDKVKEACSKKAEVAKNESAVVDDVDEFEDIMNNGMPDAEAAKEVEDLVKSVNTEA